MSQDLKKTIDTLNKFLAESENVNPDFVKAVFEQSEKSKADLKADR